MLSSHWDREWYQTFQNYRYQLVGLLDAVIAGYDEGRLRGPFTMDGQAILLEDYLEVRPECEERVRELVAGGELRVGPWYVLPDEFLVSGESMLRNLRLGRAVARRFGGVPSDAGFACDLFGHIGQLPQILGGFGIKAGLLWRGLPPDTKRHLIWEGADGTELVCYKYGDFGYCSYCFHVRGSERHKEAHSLDVVRRRLREFLESEAAVTEIDTVLVFDGGDHQIWDERAYEALVELLDGALPGFQVEHTDLDGYLAEVMAQRRSITARVKGELREPLKDPNLTSYVIQGVLSSRVNLKQRNAACEAALTLLAEPLAVLAQTATGAAWPRGFLDTAWRWLLQNHPHDSIGGCSIDAVHEDMRYRFAQCEQVAERLTLEATQRIAAHVEGVAEGMAVRVVVFNPLPRQFAGTADLELELPVHNEYPSFGEFFGYEAKPAFRLFGPDGDEIPYQRTGQAMGRARTRIHLDKFPWGIKVNRVRVSLPLDVPALGYTTLTVKPGEKGRPTRHPAAPSIVAGPAELANEHLEVAVTEGGRLRIAAREGRKSIVVGGLLFEDAADIGDGWHHGPPVNDQTFTSVSVGADVAIVDDGPQVGALRIVHRLRVPENFDFAAMRRSTRLVDMPVETTIRLRRGARHLECETNLVNVADDHRLRVCFEAEGIAATTYLADSAFDVVERPVALRPDNHLYKELEVATKPQLTWTALCDRKSGAGLAVISSGLLETAALGARGDRLALTLFRATRKTVLTDGEPGGELRCPLSFRYWLRPLTAAPNRAEMCGLGQRLAAGLRCVSLQAYDIALHRREGVAEQPPTAGLLEIVGDAVVTSLREVDGKLELRLFNPNTKPVEVVVRRPKPVVHGCAPLCEATPVNFESRATRAPVVQAERGRLRLRLGPKKIATYRLR